MNENSVIRIVDFFRRLTGRRIHSQKKSGSAHRFEMSGLLPTAAQSKMTRPFSAVKCSSIAYAHFHLLIAWIVKSQVGVLHSGWPRLTCEEHPHVSIVPRFPGPIGVTCFSMSIDTVLSLIEGSVLTSAFFQEIYSFSLVHQDVHSGFLSKAITTVLS